MPLTNRQLFPQNVIAVIWDFDKTLIPGNMQSPLFRRYEIDEAAFWDEVDGLEQFYLNHGAHRVARDALYLHHLLTYVGAGKMEGLSNDVLHELGKEVEFYRGIPDFLDLLKKAIESEPKFAEHQVVIEHYIVSTGLRQMILGSAVAPYTTEVWACEFAELIATPGYSEGQEALFSPDREIKQLVYTIDNTTKTRAIFEINKGANRNPAIDVNSKIAPEDRRVPFQNMIYIADGPSDVPVFSVVGANGGRTYAVYRPGSEVEFEQANRLLEQDRIDSFGEADYTEGSQTSMWVTNAARQIGHRIVRDREEALADRVGLPPTHVDE